MLLSRWAALAFAACVEAQSFSTSTTSHRATVTRIVTESVSSILTVTVTTTVTVSDGSSSTSASIVTPSDTVTPSSTSTSPTSSPTSSSVFTSASSTSTTTSSGPVVTDEPYIDTILRHHNVHRTNSSANALTWNSSLADTAMRIASSCIYEHNTTTDGGGYGQNIAAGFPSNMMGAMMVAFYNTEVNSYTYYGGEPDTSTSEEWGHYTQIVWKATTSVGCYTFDCSAQGLQNAPGIPPYFTVCNYAPPGNVVGAFTQNVVQPLGNPSIDQTYGCESQADPDVNCLDSTGVVIGVGLSA